MKKYRETSSAFTEQNITRQVQAFQPVKHHDYRVMIKLSKDKKLWVKYKLLAKPKRYGCKLKFWYLPDKVLT